jgi:hypothetical protein
MTIVGGRPVSWTPGRLLAFCVLLGLVAGCRGVAPPETVMSVEDRLAAMWTAYRGHYMHPGGDVRDPLRDGRVTSEAQSYALLQAAWLRDRDTFERVRHWTDAHLRRPDGLYAWLWDPGGSGRIVDANTATDADIDIAFALTIAAVVFERPDYADEARRIVRAIREVASVQIGQDRLPSAGNWAQRERIINLSYFAPYAFAYFEQLDPDAGWLRTIDIGYDLVAKATAGRPLRLPADFAVVTAAGELADLPRSSTLGRSFSYDAIRIVWRLEAACRLGLPDNRCGEPSLLGARLDDLWRRDGRFAAAYDWDGRARSSEESLSFYGAFLPTFSRHLPNTAESWRDTVLTPRTLADLARSSRRYYDANWVWFGLALEDGFIVRRTPSIDAVRTLLQSTI